jgi:hypothetical protein
MHQANAIATHVFSERCAGFHHTAGGDSIPVFTRPSSGQWGRREAQDLPEAPAGVADDHHDDARDQEQERLVIEALSQRDLVPTASRGPLRFSHGASPLHGEDRPGERGSAANGTKIIGIT